MKCTHCGKTIREKDNKAYIVRRTRKIYFCWPCNSAGKVEEYLDKASEEVYNDDVPEKDVQQNANYS